MKVCLIVQARMGSQRLPGKVLKPVLGKPLLSYELERLGRVASVDEIIVATSEKDGDDVLAQFCIQNGHVCVRGDERDVLSRFYKAALACNAETVVRVTGDCPLIDPSVVDKTVRHYLDANGRYDYVSNVLKRSYPRGMDTEVFSFRVLEEANHEAVDAYEREHVTPFIYGRPSRFKLGSVESDHDHSAHRWTVDTSEDFMFVEKILTVLYPTKPDLTMEDILSALKKSPEWSQINCHIEQKKNKGEGA